MDYSELARVLAPSLSAYFHDYDGTRDLGRGTAFPLTADVRGGLLAGDRFWRSDLGFACYYDGTRWLTVAEHSAVYPMISLGTTNGSYIIAPLRTDYAPYVTRRALGIRVNTTNNGTNYWIFTLRGFGAGYSGFSNIDQGVTSGSAAGAWVFGNQTPNVTATPANATGFDLDMTKFGSPGAPDVTATLFYRLIVT